MQLLRYHEGEKKLKWYGRGVERGLKKRKAMLGDGLERLEDAGGSEEERHGDVQ